MPWECKQHGKNCKSYSKGIAEDLNKIGMTPEFLSCVKYVSSFKERDLQ